MSGNETVYTVRIDYKLGGSATSELKQMSNEAKHTASSLEGLKGVFSALAGGFVIHEAWKHFIDFNREIEQMKIGLAAIIELNLGGSFEDASKKADRFFNTFQNFSKKAPVTTREIQEFANGIAPALFNAGGSLKDFEKIATKGVIASKVFGARNSAYAQIEFAELLSGNVNKRMLFAQQILGAAHITEEKFKALSSHKRIDVLEKVLDSGAMTAALEKYSHSYQGVWSTLQDNIEISLGKMGSGLFERLKGSLEEVNHWIDTHGPEIEDFGKKVGDALVEGFETLKSVFQFILDHKDTLITIAEAYAVSKIGGGILGLAGGLGKGIAGGGLTAGLPGLLVGVGAAVAVDAAPKLAEIWSSEMKKGSNAEALSTFSGMNSEQSFWNTVGLARDTGSIVNGKFAEWNFRNATNTTDIAPGSDELESLRNDIMVGSGGSVDALETFDKAVNDANSAIETLKDRLGVASTDGIMPFTEALQGALGFFTSGQAFDTAKKFWDFMGSEMDYGKRRKANEKDITANIKIEVTSPDPDRFVLGLQNALQDIAENPTQAHDTLSELGQ